MTVQVEAEGQFEYSAMHDVTGRFLDRQKTRPHGESNSATK